MVLIIILLTTSTGCINKPEGQNGGQIVVDFNTYIELNLYKQ